METGAKRIIDMTGNEFIELISSVMHAKKEEEKEPNAEKPQLTVKEAAIFLNMSKASLYQLTCKKQIPHYKPSGGKLFFYRSDLEAWVRQNKIKTTEEIESQAQSYCMRKKLGNFK